MQLSESELLQFITRSPSKVSFSRLHRHFRSNQFPQKKELKALITGLIQAGKLCYTSHFGTTYIELSYDQPRLVSDHVVLKPPLASFTASPGQVVVELQRGASFGVGEHPTTRLAIQLIDAMFHSTSYKKNKTGLKVLDVGTGSGVLAIVAAKMGIRAVHAIDTDPCAVYEACQNVRLNQLEAFVTILDGGLGTIGEGYDLVFANLRTPTLFSLRDSLEKKIDSDAVLVFSGIKTEECGSISDYYAQTGYSVLKKRSEMGWSAISFSKGPILKRKD